MKRGFWVFLLAFAFLASAGDAHASVGFKKAGGNPDAVADLDVYPTSAVSVSNGVGKIDNRIAGITSGTIQGVTVDGTTLGQTTSNTVYKQVVLISATNDTVNTVTPAKSGADFILTSQVGPVTASNALGWTLTLPQATANTTGLNYKFLVATSQSLAVVAVTGDTIAFGGGCTRMTSPASSPSTLALVSNSNGTWYVEDILPNATGSTLWVTGTK